MVGGEVLGREVMVQDGRGRSIGTGGDGTRWQGGEVLGRVGGLTVTEQVISFELYFMKLLYDPKVRVLMSFYPDA